MTHLHKIEQHCELDAQISFINLHSLHLSTLTLTQPNRAALDRIPMELECCAECRVHAAPCAAEPSCVAPRPAQRSVPLPPTSAAFHRSGCRQTGRPNRSPLDATASQAGPLWAAGARGGHFGHGAGANSLTGRYYMHTVAQAMVSISCMQITLNSVFVKLVRLPFYEMQFTTVQMGVKWVHYYTIVKPFCESHLLNISVYINSTLHHSSFTHSPVNAPPIQTEWERGGGPRQPLDTLRGRQHSISPLHAPSPSRERRGPLSQREGNMWQRSIPVGQYVGRIYANSRRDSGRVQIHTPG